MGREELLRDLRQRGEEEVRQVWKKAREAASKEARRLEEERTSGDRQHARERKAEEVRLRRQMDRERERRLRQRRSEILSEMLQRVRQLARDELAMRRREGGDRLLEALLEELPDLPWTTLRVHPEQCPVVSRLRPKVQVEGDQELSGGVVARLEVRALTVDNSLDRRLDRLWPAIVPTLADGLLRGEGP